MKRYSYCGLLALVACNHAWGAPTAFMTKPDIHGDKVVFTAEGDLWLGSITEGTARRLTTHEGVETDARFSPDGKTIAFSGQYDSWREVYTMPVEGGVPKRLTYISRGAEVRGWTPDGKKIIFRSRKDNFIWFNRLFTVPAGGGQSEMLPVPQGEFASLNTDGRLAYVPKSAEFHNWFRYEGGTADDIWIANLTDKTFERVTTHPAIDTAPIWFKNDIFFVSERLGVMNLMRLDPKSKRVNPVTRYKDVDVRYPATDGKRIVFQKGAGLGLYDPESSELKDLVFKMPSDRIHELPQRVNASDSVSFVSIGPTGKRLLVESRGQLLSVPAEKGDIRVIESTPGARAMFPAWSADGKKVAFISDRSGEMQVWVADADTGANTRQLTTMPKKQYFPPVWAPDGSYIAVGDREQVVYLIDVLTGRTTLVDQADRGGAYDAGNGPYLFSPDSKYLAYVKQEPTWLEGVYIYDIVNKRSVRVSQPTVNSYSPAWDPKGRYLMFLQDRVFEPSWSGWTRRALFDRTVAVSMLVLAKDTPSPFLEKNDEEGAPKGPNANDKAEPTTKIDWEGLQDRVIDVPIPPGRYIELEASADRLYLLEPNSLFSYDRGIALTLHSYDIDKRELNSLGNAVDFDLSHDRSKILVFRAANNFGVIDAKASQIGNSRVSMQNFSLTVSPKQEWQQIFLDSWRVARDFFYDPNMHGVDWDAIKIKYQALMPLVGDRIDLTRILADMISELNIGHAYVDDPSLYIAGAPFMGYLGIDVEPVQDKDAVRITKLYGSDEFQIGLRSPLLEPGMNVKPGDYILAIGGKPVKRDEDMQALLIGTPGLLTSIMVNDKPTMEGARTVRVKPFRGQREVDLRYNDWVDSRREYVRKNGGENFGYLHVFDMGPTGLTGFAKGHAANLYKTAMIYDVRYNTGGNTSSLLLENIDVKPGVWFKPRHGASWTRENWANIGHKAAIGNEYDFSDGELFLYAFRKRKIGPVIGTRTAGGEVGSGGGYFLVDGGKINIPSYGAWDPDNNEWIIEGVGVVPDIEVENDPASVMAGRDPQLDKAIQYLKEKLRKEPIKPLTPPPFPNKANVGSRGAKAP